MDEAHRRGRQDGVAEFAAEGGVLPGGELGPEPQPVAHPDRGPGDGHRGRGDLTPAAVPAGTGCPRTARDAGPGLRHRTGTRTHARTTVDTGTGTDGNTGTTLGTVPRGRAGPLPVRSAQPVPEPHTITRLR